MPVPHKRQLGALRVVTGMEHTIRDLSVRLPNGDRDLVALFEGFHYLAQLLERPQRKMCPHAEAQLAHHGALGAIAELVFDDAA